MEEIKTELEKTQNKLVEEQKISGCIIDCLPGFYFMIDEKRRYMRWNKNVETMLGYSHNELLGRDCLDLVPEEDKAKVRKATEQGFREGSFKLEYHNIRKDGKKIPYFGQGVSTEIAGQRYIVGVELDLTKLRNTERALWQSEEHLRSLMETAVNFAVYRIAFEKGDPEKARIIFVSPSIKIILGIRGPEKLDNWFENIHPEDTKRVKDSHFSLPRNTQVNESMRIYNPNYMQWRWIQFISTSVMDKSGSLKYSNGIIFDTTESVRITEKLKEKEEELNRKTNKLAQLNTALQVLVEHREQEISDIERSTLNTFDCLIKPYLNDLTGTTLSDEQRTYIEIIQSNLEKITSPLSKKLSTWQHRLTPMEIKVADMIRNGKTTKEIAELLYISANAVFFHRKNLRKKFGLVNKKNQPCHLSSIPGSRIND